MTVVVEARNLRQVYKIRRGFMRSPALLQAVGGVSFTIEEGKTLAVVGESGCGKSTLGRMAAGLLAPTEGQVLVNGQPYHLQSSPTLNFTSIPGSTFTGGNPVPPVPVSGPRLFIRIAEGPAPIP